MKTPDETTIRTYSSMFKNITLLENLVPDHLLVNIFGFLIRML